MDYPEDIQEIIDDLNKIYVDIAQSTIYCYETAPARRDAEVLLSQSSNIKRARELTGYLQDAGYIYEYFRGWIK